MATVKGQIPVRGTCAQGHTTEATSDPGRVTWEGQCAHDGCELKVKAKRIPGTVTEPGAPAKKAPAKPAGGDDPHRVIEVEYDVDDPEPGPRAGGTEDGPDGAEPGAGEGTPAGVQEGPESDPEPVRPQPRRGNGQWRRGRPKLSRAERRAARRAADREWVIPNVLPR